MLQIPAEESNPTEERFFLVGSTLSEDERKEMVDFLRKNVDVFAWQPSDMPGIDAEVRCHRLHSDKSFKPIKQKSRRAAPDKAKAIEEEV